MNSPTFNTLDDNRFVNPNRESCRLRFGGSGGEMVDPETPKGSSQERYHQTIHRNNLFTNSPWPGMQDTPIEQQNQQIAAHEGDAERPRLSSANAQLSSRDGKI